MAFSLALLAGIISAFSSLFIRKSVDANQTGTGDPYLIFRLLASAAIVLLFTFIKNGLLHLDFTLAILGAMEGLLLGALMWLTGQTVKRGPAALTFAIVNSACMAPPLLMALLFGEPFGHSYTVMNGIGATLMLMGLFWAASRGERSERAATWVFWIAATFAVHSTFLTVFQWRALLFKDDLPSSPLLPFHLDASGGDSFTLFMFLTATLAQFFLPKSQAETGKTSLSSATLWFLGIFGGLCNGLGSILLLLSTDQAMSALQRVWIFPIYCLTLIFVCNLWAAQIYKEKIHWPGLLLCLAGILINFL